MSLTFEWDEAAWRLDTEMLTPEARGIYRDILGHLYLQKDRSGVITGTREELARAGRCSAVQADLTIQEIAKYKVAEVTERNGLVTLINRRLHKCNKRRENGRLRVANHRQTDTVTPVKRSCNAPRNASVTRPPRSPLIRSDKENTDKALSSLSSLPGKDGKKVHSLGSRWGKLPHESSASSAFRVPRLTASQRSLADRFEIILGHQWTNDAGKWINRLKNTKTFGKTERVCAEVESATKENRVRETPAQYAEHIWEEFS